MAFIKRLFTRLTFRFLFLLLFILGFGITEFQPSYGQTTVTESKDKGKQEYPQRLKERETWEWILSSPGLLINLPFHILLKGISWTAGNLYVPGSIGPIYDLLTSDDGLRAARPTYSSRSGVGFKIYQKDLLSKGSKLQGKATAGLRYRQRYQLEFTRLNLFGGLLYSNFIIKYKLYPDESFFGVGKNTNKDERTNFCHEQGLAHLSFGKMLSGKIEMMTTFSFEQNNIFKGKDVEFESTTDIYNKTNLPGLENKVRILGALLELQYNSTIISSSIISGQEVWLGGGFFRQVNKGNYGFWKMNADIRQYIHLFYQRSLMFRFAGEMTEPFSNKTVPFYYLSELGRSETIRGFRRGRFRDLDMVLGSVEYYYPVWQRLNNTIDTFLFVDAGQVARDITKDFDSNDLQIGIGGGFRLLGSEGETLRIMLTRSKEQFRFYFILN